MKSYSSFRVFSREILVPAAPAGFGMLRLGTVYDAPSIRREALLRFVNSEWAIMSKCPELDSDSENALEIIWKPTDAIVLANLALEHKVYRLLPLALYACCQLEGRDLLNGCYRLGYSEQLDPWLMEKVLSARRRLALHSASILDRVPREGNSGCKNLEPGAVIAYNGFGLPQVQAPPQSLCWKGACADSLPQVPRAITMVWHPVLKLNTWRAYCLRRSLCSSCVAWVEEEFEAQKALLLKDLPRIMGVDELVERPTHRLIGAY